MYYTESILRINAEFLLSLEQIHRLQLMPTVNFEPIHSA